MTRINVGIDPKELPSKLLLAEHREIKRIPNGINQGLYHIKDIPKKFCLGTGHVKFFLNKIKYLDRRYNSIHLECLLRGFDISDYSESFKAVPKNLQGDYFPTIADRNLLVSRISERGFQLLNVECLTINI
jgi:deoxyribonuclease (pyrimidine dimer)